MGLSVSISLDVPPLLDDDIWFADAAAWSEYWREIDLVATFDAINNTLYVPVAYDYTINAPTVTADDNVAYALVTKEMVLSLIARYDTLETNYKILRNELKAAGLLQNSQ